MNTCNFNLQPSPVVSSKTLFIQVCDSVALTGMSSVLPNAIFADTTTSISVDWKPECVCLEFVNQVF